ncbi:MAG: hypothetical protein Q8L48_38085 [Archangium sp.]|nr:hypothetical protein [Archangium sp.]
MATDDWTLSLVFEAPGGAFHVEPRRVHGALGDALAQARRDGKAGAFGRTFLGFSAIEQTPQTGAPETSAMVTSETNPVKPMTELLGPHRHEDDGRTLAETPRCVELAGLEAVQWWALEGAFGAATQVGVALGRCASTDAQEAKAAAWLVGESIAHQQQLYPVTPEAVPFVVDLLCAPQVSCRAVLAGWLHVVIGSAIEANDAFSGLIAFAAKLVARDHAGAMASHRQAAKEVAVRIEALLPRLQGLTEDPVVGDKIKLMLAQLR